MTTCEWQQESEDDATGRISFGPMCGKPATSVSCVPFLRTPTCDEHKCRCARPLRHGSPHASTSETPGDSTDSGKEGS
jgi:hypothetical protein